MMHCRSERDALAAQRKAQEADMQARLQQELLAQKASLEQQAAQQRAQLDNERALVGAAGGRDSRVP